MLLAAADSDPCTTAVELQTVFGIPIYCHEAKPTNKFLYFTTREACNSALYSVGLLGTGLTADLTCFEHQDEYYAQIPFKTPEKEGSYNNQWVDFQTGLAISAQWDQHIWTTRRARLNQTFPGFDTAFRAPYGPSAPFVMTGGRLSHPVPLFLMAFCTGGACSAASLLINRIFQLEDDNMVHCFDDFILFKREVFCSRALDKIHSLNANLTRGLECMSNNTIFTFVGHPYNHDDIVKMEYRNADSELMQTIAQRWQAFFMDSVHVPTFAAMNLK